MFFFSWLRKRTAKAVRLNPARQFVPQTEVLEGRDLPSFGPAVSYPLGARPEAVVTADVNNDGRLDLITTDIGTNSVSVMLGKGNGSFSSPKNYDVGARPSSTTVGDVNGDGKLDIVTANWVDNSISVLLGNGKGGFKSPQLISVGPHPYSVALADFNSDGKLDAAVANFGTDQYGSGSTLSVLLGNGDGTFGTAQNYSADAGSATILAADFNGDGKVDLLTEHQWGLSVSLRPGNGDGTFGAAQTVASLQYYSGYGVYLTGLAVGDLNNDGKPDFTLSYGFSNVLWSGVPLDSAAVWLNQGDGTFAGSSDNQLAVGNTHNTMAIADFTGDGKADILAVGYGDYGYGVSILAGNGDGTFGPAQFSAIWTSPPSYSYYPVGVAVGDFNHDGLMDLAIADYDASAVEVLLNQGATSGHNGNGHNK